MTVNVTPKPRRDANVTRANILAAAKKCFSEMGYTAAGIRDVAAEAGVSYAMVGKYFGSKAGLLTEAMLSTMSVDLAIRVDRSRFGENLARLIVSSLSNDAPMSMTILSAGDAEARAITGAAVETNVVQPLSEWLGQPGGRERAVAITMMACGFVTFTQHIPLMDAPNKMDQPMVRWLATSFQQIVDGSSGWDEKAESANVPEVHDQ